MAEAIERAGTFRVLKKTGGICDPMSNKLPYTSAYSLMWELARNMITNGNYKPYLAGEMYIKLESPKGEIVELSMAVSA